MQNGSKARMQKYINGEMQKGPKARMPRCTKEGKFVKTCRGIECENVLRQVCKDLPREVCKSVPREECFTVPKEECSNIPREVCETKCIFWCKVCETG